MVCNSKHIIYLLAPYPSTKAGVILAIQVQLLTSGSMVITTTHVILYFGIILELLGILLLAICFPQLIELYHAHRWHSSEPPLWLVHLVSMLPTMMILTGIVVLAAVPIVEVYGAEEGLSESGMQCWVGLFGGL
jgi:hypothetical protein